MTHTKSSIGRRLACGAWLLACGLGAAQAADLFGPTPANFRANEVRVGYYYVHFDAKAQDLSGPFTPPGINLRVGDVTTPYFAYVRRFDTHWQVEFAGGLPPVTHTFGKGPTAVGSLPFNGQEVATARWMSPTVLLEYKFLDESKDLRPFIGLGMNYTRFFSRNSTAAGQAINGGPTSVSLSSSWGPAGTMGFAYRFTPRVSGLLSLSAGRVNSRYTSNTSGVIRTTTVHFNPETAVASISCAF